MPYNTRRKSLSLAELGIIPKRSRTASTSHLSPPSTVDGDEPPVKKSKTSHAASRPSPPARGDMSPPRTTTIRIKDERPQPVAATTAAAQLSPPPSPLRDGNSKVDTEGISDDIVVATINQLQSTGNRPHLVKELAAVLAPTIPAVDKSANPSALISSRLTTYLNRARPAFTPCPVAKLIEPVHPRRLYFYLTTMPRQPIPVASDLPPKLHRIISPSLSSAPDEEDDDRYQHARTALSPSPEVDLSSPELEDQNPADPPTPSGAFSARNSIPRDHPPTETNLAHNRRAASPQLEPEERTFKQTATQLHEQAQRRQDSMHETGDGDQDTAAGAQSDRDSIAMSVEPEGDSEERAAMRNRQVAAELFFEHADHLKLPASAIDFSSPTLLPQTTGLHLDLNDLHPRLDRARDGPAERMTLDVIPRSDVPDSFAWDTLQSPENIELAELDHMFDAF